MRSAKKWLVVATVLVGCRAVEPTEILLVVDSDLNRDVVLGPIEIDEVEVRVMRVVGPARSELDGGTATMDSGADPEAGVPAADAGSMPPRASCDAVDGETVADGYRYLSRHCAAYRLPSEALPDLPLRLGVLPGSDWNGEHVAFEAIARLDGREVVRQVGHVAFERHRVVRVLLWLSASCRGVTCPDGQTCRLGGCADVEVPEECVPHEGVDAGDLRLCGLDAGTGPGDDGGAPDDGRPADDAGVDGGMRVDTGPPTECSPGATETDVDNCGNCGEQTNERTCRADGTWGAWRDDGCQGEGACARGETESSSSPCGNCGMRSCSRTCSGSCAWGGWTCGGCTGDGLAIGATCVNNEDCCSGYCGGGGNRCD
jgi:hypothetical protein